MRPDELFASTHRVLLQNLKRAWSDSGEQWRTLASLANRHTQTGGRAQTEAIRATGSELQAVAPRLATPAASLAFAEYVQDSVQRGALFLEMLCRRGDSCLAREQEEARPLLAFDYEMIVDGRKMERPVNYALVRVLPADGTIAPKADARPWMIIDPRAGHGSGIGGSKNESEVGVALKFGHPVYFVIFFPDPEPEQTLADVCAAEAAFLREIQTRHPHSPKPLLTGNCQGGWAAMILAAVHPNLMGPIVVAGAPLSYWSGEMARNPFRYLAGMAGGALPALLMSDLGAGKFDGANLVMNFEALNPAKTWFRKYHDLFVNVDDEADRFLELERWWSGFYFMNANEIRWIVENLFIGNRLTRGDATLNDGTPLDLTRIKAPIIVFASHGDNITPPQQALNWIPDLYPSVKDIQAHGRVIIYTLHDSVGHLGIFVSAQVASQHHEQIGSVIKTIESLAPGLYEMLVVTDPEGRQTANFEARTIDDILALDDGRDDEAGFAAVSGLSEWATKTYELTWQPLLRALVTPELAEAMKRLHPMRQQRTFFTHANPLFSQVEELAQQVRDQRVVVAPDNPFRELERIYGDWFERSMNLCRDMRDASIELAFHSLYGTPWLKHVGALHAARAPSRAAAAFPLIQEAIGRATIGGYAEGVIRMLILLARARGSVRRDRLEKSDRLLHARPPFSSMTAEMRAGLIHEQSLIVEFAGDGAISSLPDLLKDPVDRYSALNLVLDVAGPIAQMNAATVAMFKRFQSVLLTMARDWHDPDVTSASATVSDANVPEARNSSIETPQDSPFTTPHQQETVA